MQLYMGSTYVTGEPDITTDVPAWQSWFTSLSDADKIAWAESYTGAPVASKASAIGIARQYVTAAGVELPEANVSEYTISRIITQQAEDRARMVRTVLLVGAAGAVAWILLAPKKRR